MTRKKTVFGNISISYHAISTIAYQAALESYGVVGLTNENFVFNRDQHSGVVVTYEDDVLVLDLFVVIEYGTRISSVAKSVANNVKFKVEKLVRAPVSEVNVHVRGLRVSDTD